MPHAVFKAPDWLPTSAVIGTIAGLLIAGFPIGVLAGAAIGTGVGAVLKAVVGISKQPVVSTNDKMFRHEIANETTQLQIGVDPEISPKWVDRLGKGPEERQR